MSQDQYLTPEELSARWKHQINPRTLANWRVRGSGPTFLKLGGRILYPLTEVIAWETKKLANGTRVA